MISRIALFYLISPDSLSYIQIELDPKMTKPPTIAKAGMNPQTLQYLMGHSDISVTMNTYTHLGLDDARDEMVRLQELEDARKELEKTTEPDVQTTQELFRAM